MVLSPKVEAVASTRPLFRQTRTSRLVHQAESSTHSDPTSKPLPPLIRASLSAPSLEKRSWRWAVGPTYIGLFLWIVFFDQIPSEATARGGVFWSALGVLLGGVFSTVLLYAIPARLGFETGQGLIVVSTSTFGVRGAAWIPGRLIALTHLLWVSVATFYATDLCLKSLLLLGFIDPRRLTPIEFRTFSIPSSLFLVTALLWSLASSFTGKYLIRVIAALMSFFQVLPAVLLGLCAAKAFPGLPYFQPALGGLPDLDLAQGLAGMFVAMQMVLGYFAVSGLGSVDWGAVSESRKDVSLTGAIGVGTASTIIGVLAILTVGGAAGFRMERNEAVELGNLSFQASLPLLFDRRVTALLYLAFGLAALAPSCYAAFLFGTRMHEIRPRRSRTWWTFVASIGAWLLILTGFPSRLFVVFSLLGALVVPAIGAICADFLVSGSKWGGSKRGYHAPGLISWFLGFLAGVFPMVAAGYDLDLTGRPPAALFAFGVSFTIYFVLAKLGFGSARDEDPELVALLDPKA